MRKKHTSLIGKITGSIKFVSDIKSITQPKTSADLFDSGKSQTDYIDKEMPRHDVLLAGFPCQPFSIAGRV